MRDSLQLTFDDRRNKPSLEERYQAFVRENQHVVELFDRFAFELIRAGHERGSGDAIGHRIRWHCSVEVRGEAFKINNDYIALLVRDFQRRHPPYAGFFCTRKRTAA